MSSASSSLSLPQNRSSVKTGAYHGGSVTLLLYSGVGVVGSTRHDEDQLVLFRPVKPLFWADELVVGPLLSSAAA